MANYTSIYTSGQAVDQALQRGEEAWTKINSGEVGGGKIEMLYNGTNITVDGTVVNFKQIVDYLTVDNKFTYLLYNNMAYLTTKIDATSSLKQVVFESSHVDGGMGKIFTITVNSSDGVTIASINHTNVANENYSNKVGSIAENDKKSTVHYPSNKAVTDITDELKEDLSEVQKRFGFVTKSIKTNSGEHSSRIDRVTFPISNGDSFYISASSIPYINKSISVYGYVEGADSGTNIGHFYNDGNDNVLVSNGDYDEIGFFYDSFGQETITRFTIMQGDSYYENLVKMSESLKGEAYVQGFELGNISIDDSGWVYSNKTTRVRTKENTSISLSKGDIISLSDYSNARMYIGWKNKNGIYGTSNRWFSSPFLVSEDGEYVIVLINNPETEVSSVESLSLR